MRPMPELEVREMAVADLVPYANNAKKHPREQIDQIAESISQFGNCDPIAVWHNEDGQAEIVEGHGRVMALKQLGIDTAPVIFLDHLTDEQRRAYTHVHNQTTLSSDFDYGALVEDMDNLNMDWEALGFQEFMPNLCEEVAEEAPEEGNAKLADRFGVAPFTVLDARKGEWADRKRAWMTIGIRSELGRGAAPGGAALPLNRAGGGVLGSPTTSMQVHQRTGGGHARSNCA